VTLKRKKTALQLFFIVQTNFLETVSTAKPDRNVIGRKRRKTAGIFTRRDTMIIGNKTFDTKHHGYIMGILNVTPDSFSDGGKYDHLDAALKHAEEMIKDGAAIIDVGGESTRPGYTLISDEEEIGRVTPVIETLKKEFDVPVSLDTYKSGVARAGIEAGADLINDIWGLKWDGTMAEVLAETGIASCLMHNRKDTDYKDYLNDVIADLNETMEMAEKAGQILDYLERYSGSIVCSKQLYKEALGHDYDEPKQWELREINDIMNNAVTGWRAFSNPRYFPEPYRRQKGWERIRNDNEPDNSMDGFQEIPTEEMEQLGLPEEWLKQK